MNEHRISSHKVEGDTIAFYHYMRETTFVEGKGICFGEPKEVLWFKLILRDDTAREFSLSSNGAKIYIGYPFSCPERELMDYLRRAKLGKLVSSRKLVNYDEDAYGRVVERGFYDYEIWDLSNIK